MPHPRTALSGYADGRLHRLRRTLVHRHLSRCTRCAVEVAQIRSLRGLLTRPEPPAPSAELLQRLLEIGHAPRPTGLHGRARGPRADRQRTRAGVAGVLVAGVVLAGAAGAGAVLTSPTTPWQGTGPRASLGTVLPRLWAPPSEPAGAVPVRPVDNGSRPDERSR